MHGRGTTRIIRSFGFARDLGVHFRRTCGKFGVWRSSSWPNRAQLTFGTDLFLTSSPEGSIIPLGKTHGILTNVVDSYCKFSLSLPPHVYSTVDRRLLRVLRWFSGRGPDCHRPGWRCACPGRGRHRHAHTNHHTQSARTSAAACACASGAAAREQQRMMSTRSSHSSASSVRSSPNSDFMTSMKNSDKRHQKLLMMQKNRTTVRPHHHLS